MLVEQQVPLTSSSHPTHLIPRRCPATQTTIGKNVFSKQLLEQYILRRQTREFLGRYYIRFEKMGDGNVKIGIEDDIKAPEEFVTRFVECLVESHMSGYVFIGLTVPLFKQLVKVDYTKLRRLQLVRCNITNIEPIAWLGSNRFRSIYLGGNLITSVKSLAKTNFPSFTSIQLNNNFITDFTPLARTRMTPYYHQLKNKFYLHSSLDSFNTGDLGFVFRVENMEICIVGEKSKVDRVMRQEKVLNAVMRMQTHPEPKRGHIVQPIKSVKKSQLAEQPEPVEQPQAPQRMQRQQ